MPVQSGATQEEVRRRNVSTLLREVHLRGARSRAALTESMGLNRSTIRALVGELIERGLVSETIPETADRVGRPSHLVVPRPDTAYVLAANVGVDVVTVAVVGLGGTISARREYPNATAYVPAAVADRLTQVLAEMQCDLPASSWLAGVGIAVPGLVRADGWVELAPNLRWRGVPFGQLLADLLPDDVPVRIGNDGDLGALAEHSRGAGQGLDNLVYLNGDVGVGGGIVVAGRLLFGARGYAGEIGHMVINPGGRRCRCGSYGCFETEVGEESVLVACGRSPDAGRAGLIETFAAATEGEQRAVEGLNEVARWLARGVASLVNIFDPELVILSGTLSGLLSTAGARIRAELDTLTTLTSRREVPLTPPGLGEDSALLGAAELAFEQLLDDPLDRSPLRPTPPAAVAAVSAAAAAD
jgi:predicted NBD/HSP70 family sugar kinase